MKREDIHAFTERLSAVYVLYGKDLKREVASLWLQALKSYELEVVSRALSLHCVNPDNGQFLPRPADVVKLIEGGSDDVALQAWAKVDRAVRQVGTYSSVAFDDGLIHYVIAQMGGWIALGQKTEQEWPFLRNQFVTLYRGARMRSVEHPSHLIGICEAENACAHQAIAPPVLVGNRERAMQVLARGASAQPPLDEARHARELLPEPMRGHG